MYAKRLSWSSATLFQGGSRRRSYGCARRRRTRIVPIRSHDQTRSTRTTICLRVRSYGTIIAPHRAEQKQSTATSRVTPNKRTHRPHHRTKSVRMGPDRLLQSTRSHCYSDFRANIILLARDSNQILRRDRLHRATVCDTIINQMHTSECLLTFVRLLFWLGRGSDRKRLFAPITSEQAADYTKIWPKKAKSYLRIWLRALPNNSAGRSESRWRQVAPPWCAGPARRSCAL